MRLHYYRYIQSSRRNARAAGQQTDNSKVYERWQGCAATARIGPRHIVLLQPQNEHPIKSESRRMTYNMAAFVYRCRGAEKGQVYKSTRFRELSRTEQQASACAVFFLAFRFMCTAQEWSSGVA